MSGRTVARQNWGARQSDGEGPHGHRLRVLVVCLIVSCGIPRLAHEPYDLTPAERRRIELEIKRDSTWRLAVAADSKNSRAVSELRRLDQEFEPYFSRQLGRPGSDHFAFVLKRQSEFKVLYARRFAPDSLFVTEVARMTWLDDGFVRLRGDTLEVALFNSDEIFTFVWSDDTRKMMLLP